MTRRIPDYVRERIAKEAQDAEHRANAPADCVCHICLTSAEFDVWARARIKAAAGYDSEPPF